MAGPGKGGARLCGGHRAGLCEIRGQGSGVPLSEPRAPWATSAAAAGKPSTTGPGSSPSTADRRIPASAAPARSSSLSSPACHRSSRPPWRGPPASTTPLSTAPPFVRQTRLAARARSRPNHRTRMLLQQSNKIIIAASPGLGWSIASVFPSFASSLISRSVTQLEQARVAKRHFRHHCLVVGRDGAVA